MGVNTVLRSLMWSDDGKDEILYFNNVYGACGKTIDYIVDSNGGRVSARQIGITYPCEDEDIMIAFKGAIQESQSAGKRPKICLFDTVSSLPGLRFPFELVTAACKEFGILSLVDGAQGIGQIKLDLTALDPDFFVTNCHKWLHVPRGCAVFYVPFRNQELIPSSIPTSHGYVSATGTRFNPLPPSSKPAFVYGFEFVGTLDTSPYLCVKDAIKWRKEVLGGEERIMEYTQWLAKEGGKAAAAILGTEILENGKGTLTNCAMVNVALPIDISPVKAENNDDIPKDTPQTETITSEIIVDLDSSEKPAGSSTRVILPLEESFGATQWMLETLMRDYKTFIALFVYGNKVWARLSAQVYLGLEDFAWAGHTLRDLSRRVASREYRATQ
jgi:selenocysteine lyase/cysteine desulfurase